MLFQASRPSRFLAKSFLIQMYQFIWFVRWKMMLTLYGNRSAVGFSAFYCLCTETLQPCLKLRKAEAKRPIPVRR